MSTNPELAVSAVLADLGTIVRRNQAGSLDQDSFYQLVGRMRRTLKALRVELAEPDLSEVALTDAGAALGRLLDAGVLKPGTEIHPGVQRARTRGHLAVIDGGRPFETPPQGN